MSTHYLDNYVCNKNHANKIFSNAIGSAPNKRTEVIFNVFHWSYLVYNCYENVCIDKYKKSLPLPDLGRAESRQILPSVITLSVETVCQGRLKSIYRMSPFIVAELDFCHLFSASNTSSMPSTQNWLNLIVQCCLYKL